MMEGCKHAYDSRRLAWNNLMKTILLASLLTVAATAQATDYYVAPDGNDHAVGTKAAPLRSIMRAQQAARAGDTVYFRGGVYA
ncbi:Pectate lyase L [Pseudomonas syringae pv. helianthi]|nr:Pectate lyase L [Pseudomonas syringae pv. helianthi]